MDRAGHSDLPPDHAGGHRRIAGDDRDLDPSRRSSAMQPAASARGGSLRAGTRPFAAPRPHRPPLPKLGSPATRALALPWRRLVKARRVWQRSRRLPFITGAFAPLRWTDVASAILEAGSNGTNSSRFGSFVTSDVRAIRTAWSTRSWPPELDNAAHAIAASNP